MIVHLNYCLIRKKSCSLKSSLVIKSTIKPRLLPRFNTEEAYIVTLNRQEWITIRSPLMLCLTRGDPSVTESSCFSLFVSPISLFL